MKSKKYIGVILSVVLIMSLILPAIVYAEKPDEKCRATEVKISKKTTPDVSASKAKTLTGEATTPTESQRCEGQSATGVLGRPLPPGGKRYAILIGISDYPGDIPVWQDPINGTDLSYADDDAVDMLEVLTGIYGFHPKRIRLLMGPRDLTEHDVDHRVVTEEATRSNILHAISLLKKKTTWKDEVVFHFSGHGAQGLVEDWDLEPIDEGILPCDSDPANPDDKIIWDGELKKKFRRVKANRMVFVFDCCNAGGMTDLKGFNRIICMATGEYGIAIEYGPDYVPVYGIPIPPEMPGLENGLFTYLFAKAGMGAGYADVYDHDGDGAFGEPDDVTIEEAYDFAKLQITPFLEQIAQLIGIPQALLAPAIKDRFRNDLLL